MADQVTIRPPVLDLALYAGDGASFKLVCNRPGEEGPEPLNITGDIQAQIRVTRSSADPIVTFDIDMSGADQGEVLFSLTGDDTQLLMEDPSVLKGKFSGVWDAQWTPPGEQPRTLCQGKVECVADVTR